MELINTTPVKNIQRILDVMYDPNNKIEEMVEIREDIDKMLDDIDLEHSDVVLIFQTLRLLKEHTYRLILKPTDLQEFLIKKLKLNDYVTEMILKAWSQKPNRVLNNLINGQELDHVSWELSVGFAENNVHMTPTPKAKIQFSIVDNEHQQKEISLDVNHAQVSELYHKLESIQHLLDRIK